MAWDDGDVVGEGEETLVDGSEKLVGVASGQVGTAYGAGEEGVSGEEESLGREVEADAAFGVAGGVEDGASEAGFALPGVGSDGDDFAVVEGVVWVGDGGGWGCRARWPECPSF